MNRQQSQFGAVFGEKEEEESYLPPKRKDTEFWPPTRGKRNGQERRGLKIGFEGGGGGSEERGKEGRKIAHAPWSILRAIRI